MKKTLPVSKASKDIGSSKTSRMAKITPRTYTKPLGFFSILSSRSSKKIQTDTIHFIINAKIQREKNPSYQVPPGYANQICT
ncbi:MAG: hypothetical protein MUO76_16395 [Anaerolineaceae bacterium]|nr:hypothetical protein [Anaerolineaceae bacterium]